MLVIQLHFNNYTLQKTVPLSAEDTVMVGENQLSTARVISPVQRGQPGIGINNIHQGSVMCLLEELIRQDLITSPPM